MAVDNKSLNEHLSVMLDKNAHNKRASIMNKLPDFFASVKLVPCKIKPPITNGFLNSKTTIAVAQREYTIRTKDNAKYILVTGPVRTCIVIILYHPKTTTTLLAHIDVGTQHETFDGILKMLEGYGIKAQEFRVHIIGGWDIANIGETPDLSENISRDVAEFWIRYFTQKGMVPNTDFLFIASEFKSGKIPCVGINAKDGKILISTESVPLELTGKDVNERTARYEKAQLALDHLQLGLAFFGMPLVPMHFPAEDGDSSRKEIIAANLLCTAASSKGDDPEALKILLADKSSNLMYKKGFTALHYACSKNPPNLQCAKVLIQNGASVLLANQRGKTPLDMLKDTVAKIILMDEYLQYQYKDTKQQLEILAQYIFALESNMPKASTLITQFLSATPNERANVLKESLYQKVLKVQSEVMVKALADLHASRSAEKNSPSDQNNLLTLIQSLTSSTNAKPTILEPGAAKSKTENFNNPLS